jgi:ariadne-1
MDDCSHILCEECFTQYLQTKVAEGVESVFTICPDQKCNMIVPPKLFKELLPKGSYDKYVGYLCQTFISLSNNVLKYCPGKGCECVVEKRTLNEIHDVTCERCNTWFCFMCDKFAHAPMDCQLLNQWLDRIGRGEEDSALWIKLNTK